MKRALTYLLCFVCFGAVAQSKIGYINTESVLKSISEKLCINQKVDRYSDSLNLILNNFYNKIAYGPCVIVSNNCEPKESILLNKYADSLNSYPYVLRDLLIDYQDKLYKPLIDSIHIAIADVATEHNYNYVLDTGNGSAYALKEGEDDLTIIVLQRLGIK